MIDVLADWRSERDMPRIRRIRKVSRNNRTIEKVDAEMQSVLPSRFKAMRTANSSTRVVLVGTRVFSLKLGSMLSDERSVDIVASAETDRSAIGAAALHGAELVIVELEFGGPVQGIFIARSIMERSPDCGIMMVCRTMTENAARHLWVYGTESWSVLTGATARNPAQVIDAVNSAVRGMTWIEPGVRRKLSEFGARPKSIEERRQAILSGRLTAEA